MNVNRLRNSEHQFGSSTDAQTLNRIPSQGETASPLPEQKRRPGRPRGSKNRRPRVGSAKHENQFYYQPPAPGAASTSTATSPQHANISPQNQQYYEFQWRVLNLCAEFYGAAEELVVSRNSVVFPEPFIYDCDRKGHLRWSSPSAIAWVLG
jgi:hypothetical protein